MYESGGPMTNPRKPFYGFLRGLSAPRLRLRGSTPVNKVVGSSGLGSGLTGGSAASSAMPTQGASGQRRLPQLDNPLLLGVAAVGALGAGLAITRLSSSGRGGRPTRFTGWVTSALVDAGYTIHPTPHDISAAPGDSATSSDGSAPSAAARHAVVRDLDVDVLEGFGKLPLISVDVRVDDASPLWSEVVGEQLLDIVAKAAWHNPEIAPVAVRGRLIGVEDGTEVLDMSGIGYETETAHPEELFARFGPPTSDPSWRG